MGAIINFLKQLAFNLHVSFPVLLGILGFALALIIVAIVVPIAVSKKRKKNKAQTPVPVEEIVETVSEPIVEEKVEVTEQETKVEEKPEEKAEEVVATAVQEKTKEKKQVKKFHGKWIIEHKSDDEFMAKLSASNGEVMLSSEIYKSEEGAINGIATIIRGIENGNFIIYQDKNKNFYYKLKTANNRLLCVGEIYKAKDQCLKAVESVKRIAKLCEINEDVVSGAEYVQYTPQALNKEGIKNGAKGTWKIEATEDKKYSARLYANNGQLMLATEEVQVKKNAENAIESVKKNAEDGNFVIDRDKFGRYYYKLRNAQKSVICIGEAYDSLDSCKSAIESVRKFALNSELN